MLSSRGQMYCCLRRPPHLAWSRLKEMADEGCAAEYRLTGMDTRQKEMVPFAMDRELMLLMITCKKKCPSSWTSIAASARPRALPSPSGDGRRGPGCSWAGGTRRPG